MSEQIIAVLGIDLGKNSVSLTGLDATGAVIVRKRTTRDGAIKFTAKLPSCVVAMEACCGAHFVARIMVGQGHTIRLMSPEYVKPYVKTQKNDDRDAEAIAEAATRPTMRFVTQKTEAQLIYKRSTGAGVHGDSQNRIDQSAPCNTARTRPDLPEGAQDLNAPP